MSQQEVNQREWGNPDNWSGCLVECYFSKRDTRTWVPKRMAGLGWTPNLAKPAGAWWLVAIILFPACLALALIVLLAPR
jgi:uncharacterized membrane protein